jgi:glycosyltransferase involved in cell wall biosynthesis
VRPGSGEAALARREGSEHRRSWRILHLIPNLEGGGAERQLVLLANAQARCGHEVHLGLLRLGSHADGLGKELVQVHQAPAVGHYSPLLALWVLQLVRRLRPDIVQTWFTMMDALGGVSALTSGIPWVLGERASALAYRDRWQDRLVRRAIGRLAGAVVANSAAGLRYWTAVSTRHRIQVVIRNAVDLDAIRAVAPATDWPGKNAGLPLILFAGRLAPQKNLFTLIRALSELRKRRAFSALILGEGPDAAATRALAEQCGLQEEVHFDGFRTDLWALMKVATVFVNPSRFEGHPNTVLEAIACSTPLVVSDIPEHREFLDPTTAVLVPPQDVEGLASALEAALTESDGFRRRARAAAPCVEALGVEEMVDAYDRVYRTVARSA